MNIITFYVMIINQTDNQRKSDTCSDRAYVALAPVLVYCRTPEIL